MKVYVQLFVCVIVTTCQAYLLPQNRQLITRKQTSGDPIYENFGEKGTIEQLDPNTLLIPYVNKPEHQRYLDSNSNYASQNNNLQLKATGNLMSQSAQLRQTVQDNDEDQAVLLAKVNREVELAEIDREALSKLSEADRHILVTRFSQAERESLLSKLDEDEGEFSEKVLTDSRFAAVSGSITNAASQLAAGAGRFIGFKLAGDIGAKLGSAAGAYLGAAAASRLELPHNKIKNKINTIKGMTGRGVQYGGNYGAVINGKK